MDWWLFPTALLVILFSVGVPIIDYLLGKSKTPLEMMMNGQCENCNKCFDDCNKCGKCLK